MKKIFRISAFLLALQFCVSRAMAQHEPAYVNMIQGDSIHTGKSLLVADSVFLDSTLRPTILRTNYVHNLVSLRINEFSSQMLPDSFILSVKIKVLYTDTARRSDSTSERTLTIEYNKLRPYTNKSIFYFQNAYYADVHVTDVTCTYATLSTVLAATQLENRMVIDRDFMMDCSNNAIHTITQDTTTIATMGELKLQWEPNRVSQQYDVEWTYLDKSAIDSGRYDVGGHLDPALIFRNNASRITIVADTCLIPLLYDGEGTLFYRIRGVQTAPDGELVTTQWSSEVDPVTTHWKYDFNGHQRNLNWQASTTFAEDGKHQSVVQYFDGSLRGRQTVTRNNTTQTTIVAETLYDQQGRPAIQVMPAPTLSKLIAYTPSFNVADMNSREYDKGIYDTLESPAAYCGLGADSMSVVSGAARYYSNLNPLKDSAYNQFIPKDSGYVFTETQYTQDNTGRVYRQSGVGQQFRLGSGHETKYYYGKPDANELDALFGTEVGDASHYQKNMVRDANGQYSVSYVDMHGRTVATALAGASPSSLQALSSYRDSLESEELLTPISNTINGNGTGFSSSFFMTKTDSVWLHYSVGKQSLKLEDCRHDSICYDCLYDLTITVTGDCNSQVSGADSKTVTLKNFALFHVDTTCGLAVPIDTTIAMVLSEGSYNITKQLTINTDGMNRYRDSVFLPRNTCKTYDDFFRDKLAQLHDSLTCATDTLNEPTGDHYREQMLLDMYPLSGQYGDSTSGRGCFSIFDKQDGKYLYQVVADTTVYRNEAGAPDSVVNAAGQLVPPQNLTADEFISNFKDSWAPALLSLHPEYCLLTQYERLSASHAWDDDFETTDTYAAARAKGFLNPTGSTSTPASGFGSTNTDPLYGYSFTTGAKTAIEDSLFHAAKNGSNYLTAWGLASSIIECGVAADTACINHWNNPSNAMNSSLMCPGELDMAWRIFRGIYLNLKRQWEDQFIHAQCAGQPYPHQPCTPVFPRRDSILASSGYGEYTGAGDATIGQDSANVFYAENCNAYRDRWKQQLGSCYNDAQKEVIVNYLVQVCQEGADNNHPFGASTVRPASTYTYRSFDAVIRHVNDSLGNTNVACNAYLIDQPEPYNQQMFPVNKEVYTKPDSCSCARISSVYSSYLANSSSYTSFSDYMLKVQHTTISEANLDSLLALCNESASCSYLQSPVVLPPALQCGANTTSCVDCKLFAAAYDSFVHRFPGLAPVMEPVDTNQQRVNTVFANYINQYFGFRKTAQEYLAFQQACDTFQASVTPSGLIDTAMNCTNMLAVYNAFIHDYPGIYARPPLQYDSDGVDVSNWTLNEGGYDHDMRYHFKDFVQNGILRTPYDDSLSTHVNFNYHNVFCVDGGFALEARIRFKIDSARKAMYLRQVGGTGTLYGGLFYELFTNIGGPYTEKIFGDIAPVATGPYPLFQHYVSVPVSNDTAHQTDYAVNIPGAVDTLTDWHVLHIENKGGYVKTYLDTNLLYTTVNPYPVRTVGAFALSESGYDLEIDWVKFFDVNDSLRMFEDFGDTLWAPSGFDRSCIYECEDRFTDYFNYHFGTHMTYGEITKAYEACYLVNPTPCQGDSLHPSPTLCGGNEPLDSLIDAQPPAPCADSTNIGIVTAVQLNKIYQDSIAGHFNEAYTQKCLSIASKERMTLTKAVSEYHYTLYYYDQAGNLVKTVPPEGVHPNRSSVFLDSVRARRMEGLDTVPQHTLATIYRYNTLNQLVSQKSPDGGRSQFWYDRLGRLAISQNAKQRGTGDYSYTVYDAIGRIMQVGQKHQPNGMSQSISRSAPDLYKWITFRDWDDAYWPTQVTLTGYDDPSLFASVEVGQTPFHQKSWTLRNRVSWTRYFDLLNVTNSVSGTDTSYTLVDQYFNTAIEYSYDIHGNVDSMLNIGFLGTIPYSFGKNAFKMIAYKYDLISGKVNEVHYNPGYADEFYHRYEYDADNRLTDVYTTDNKAFMGQAGLEDHDAHYTYYKHGPLARTVLGEQQVQGLDYAYTLQGWLKGVNSSSLNPAHDMGEDGKSGSVNRFVARDALGFNLNYFVGDYTSISGLSPFASAYGYLPSGACKPLYNGNISSMAVNIGKFSQPQLYGYGYDQLNRLVSMDVYRGLDSATNDWGSLSATTDYKERITYDGNGNIQTYLRHGISSIQTQMDSLFYHYNTGTNQLDHVNDPVSYSNYPKDIDDQPLHNFRYDSTGNIISDSLSKIAEIDWTVYGKISKIGKVDPELAGDATEIDYRYDPNGNRVQKTDWKYSAPAEITWYARDAQGNVMAVYDMTYNSDFSFGPFKLKEHHVYGSSRLGIIQRDQDMDSVKVHAINEGLLGPTYLYTTERGHKFYELSNHLGNVLTTISDRKFGVDGNSDGTVDYYTADIVSATDYYPFGSEMPNRTFSEESYRYGFNGKENDNDVKGDGNQIDYGMRVYDPRLGRFLSVDPLAEKYVGIGTYTYAEDKPTNFIDIDGLEVPELPEVAKPVRTLPSLNFPIEADLLNGRSGGSLPISRYNSGGVPPLGGAYRVDGGWDIDDPNGSWFVPDTHRGMADPEELARDMRDLKNWQIKKVVDRRAYSEKTTVLPQVQQVPLEKITNDVKNLKGQEIAEINKRLNEGKGTEQDKLYAAQLIKERINYMINDKHNPSKPAGGSRASVIPTNHAQLWDNRTTYDAESDSWWSYEGEGNKAVFHRFSGDRQGTYHWSGSTGANVNRKGSTVDPISLDKVPLSIKKKAGYKG